MIYNKYYRDGYFIKREKLNKLFENVITKILRIFSIDFSENSDSNK